VTRIAILMPLMWSVRNVIHSGVVQLLADAGIESHLLYAGDRPVAGCDTLTGTGRVQVHPMIQTSARTPRGKALVDDVLTSAFHHRHRTRSYGIYRRWFTRNHGSALRARRTLIDAAGRTCTSAPMMRALGALADRLSRQNVEPICAQLRSIAPDLVWSTANIAAAEHPYRAAARDLGVPVATSILSFDNLTSRGLLPRDAHYLVWADRMRLELKRLYSDVRDDEISVTGTPQFDFHRRRECQWPRDRTLADLGLESNASYFLYGASHVSLAPGEPALVAQLAARMASAPGIANRALVVRLHPLDDLRRWHAVAQARRVRISRAYGAATADRPAVEDHARLTSSLIHADACLNVASTMTLDAAIVDRPIVCLDFTDEPESPRDLLYAEYGCEHYAPLVQSGGVRLARNWRELLDLMEQAIACPERDRALRARMIADQCGTVDGCSAQRVARVLVHLTSRTVPHLAQEPHRVADLRARA
jgi:hypothetical protein